MCYNPDGTMFNAAANPNATVESGAVVPGTGTIEVRVLKPDGSPFIPSDTSDVSLSFGDAYYSPYSGLDPDGTYTITGIWAGTYSLTARVEGSGNPYTDSLPVNVQVYANFTQTVDIFLTNSPTLTGRVLTPEGNPAYKERYYSHNPQGNRQDIVHGQQNNC